MLVKKGLLSRTISEKVIFESVSPNSFEWVDRRGAYTFSSSDPAVIKTFQNAIITCCKYIFLNT